MRVLNEKILQFKRFPGTKLGIYLRINIGKFLAKVLRNEAHFLNFNHDEKKSQQRDVCVLH